MTYEAAYEFFLREHLTTILQDREVCASSDLILLDDIRCLSLYLQQLCRLSLYWPDLRRSYPPSFPSASAWQLGQVSVTCK